MTLYEALFQFQDLYLARLADSSRRISDPIATDWQKICNEYDLYFQAIAEGDYTTGETHLQNIVDILAANDLIVTIPVIVPLPISIYGSPSVIQVPVDYLGLNPDFTDSFSWIYVYIGGTDDSTNWTFTITGVTNVTANISDVHKLNITAITADTGSVTIEISKGGYATLTFVILVNKVYDAKSGIGINVYPSTIFILCDPFGIPLSYLTAISTIVIREGTTDETANWNLAVFSQVNVTANITGGDTVNITNITADQGSVTVRCTRAGYSDNDVYIPVQKQYLPEDGLAIDLYPGTIIIPCDPLGVPISYAQAYSDLIIRNGVDDETSSWAISITGSTNVTANITGGNRINITNITADEGTVDLQCTRAGYPNQDITLFVQKQLQGSALIGAGSVDNVTIGLNGLSQLEVKDDGISTLKIDSANVFNQLGSLIEYDKDGTNFVLVPTVVRRALGATNSIESSHAVGFGTQNISLGFGSILGPSGYETEYSVNYYDTGLNYILINDSEGDVSSAFTASDKVLVWDAQDDGAILGYTDAYRYYIVGTVVSSGYTGSQTYVEITEDFTVEDQVYNYIINNGGPAGSMVCARYAETGVPYPKYGNILLGSRNRINGSNSIVIGSYWSLEEGPDLSGAGGNTLIGKGTNVKGNLNTFIIHPYGNSYSLTFHEDSIFNLGIGAFLSFGNSGDSVGRKGNIAIGIEHNPKCNASTSIGFYGESNTDGEIVIGGGDPKSRKVMAQLVETTTSTSATVLKTFGDSGSVGLVFATPSNYKIIANSVLSFTIDLMGVQSSGNIFRRRMAGLIRNISGTTALVGTINEDANYAQDDFTPTAYTVTADDVNDELVVTVTPAAAISTKWLAWVEGYVIEF